MSKGTTLLVERVESHRYRVGRGARAITLTTFLRPVDVEPLRREVFYRIGVLLPGDSDEKRSAVDAVLRLALEDENVEG